MEGRIDTNERKALACFDVLREATQTPTIQEKNKIGSKASSLVQPLWDRDIEMGVRIEKMKSTEKPIRRAKSLSARFLVNANEIINDMVDETGSGNSGASKDGLSYFRTSLPLYHERCGLLELHTTSQEESATSESPTAYYSNKCRSLRMDPTLPIRLEFQDVKYKVMVKEAKQSAEEKFILHGISGSVHPGEVLALMGPSGGGKTTLLNILGGRAKMDSGMITYNDQPYSKSLKKRIGFVLQDDVTFPHLTVKETLTYAALLRLPHTLTRQQKKERAMNVITELGLERCQDTVIGSTLVRGISGGERKRLCIGSEILLNPSVLLLDEPTSGLDSTTALRIIQMLHHIAKAGKTVVTTIHQPSSRLFSKFDKLILLGKGNSLYFGKASEAMLYFSSIGCSPLIAMNPAEFLIDLANGNINDKSVPSELECKLSSGSCKRVELRKEELSPVDVHEYLVDAYEERVGRRCAGSKMIEFAPMMQTRSYSMETGATWWEQFSVLFRRGLKARRQDYLSCVRITQVIATSLIVGLLWWHSDASSPKRLEDQAGVLFFVSVFWGFLPLFTAIFTFPQERAMVAKERSVDMYKLSAYFVARNISDLPLDLVLPVVFMVIVYFMVGLKLTLPAISLTMLTVFLSVMAAQGLGLFIGAAVMDVKKATTVASVVLMAFMLSGGFFVENVPWFMLWLHSISFNYHTYRLLLKIQYCLGLDSTREACQYPYIQRLKLDSSEMEVGSLVGMIIGYRLLAYFFLRRMSFKLGI